MQNKFFWRINLDESWLKETKILIKMAYDLNGFVILDSIFYVTEFSRFVRNR